ncbi:MAG TPA: MarP family serine protease [Pseudolysinimonas sp.]|nr:MarP family serine protease [Pseudolysinimonas sp.]
MLAALILDVLLVVTLIALLIDGWRAGFARSASAIIGTIAGAIIAFIAIPLVAAIIPAPFWRTMIVVALGIGLLVGGHAAGVRVGVMLRRKMPKGPLHTIDRILGACITAVASLLTIALIVGSVGALGVPVLSSAIASSRVLTAVEQLTPQPVDAALARIRAAILEQGLPTIAEALGGITSSPGAPNVDGNSSALQAAAQSVVRVGGTAYACGQNQTGSGVVIAPDRVVTNAHVVAGVEAPVIEAPNGQALDGRVVYFDPHDDLAVISVNGLKAPALPLASPLVVNDTGVVDGYPFGGPFTTGGARVLAVSTEQMDDIYGTSRSPREIYTLAARVNPGNSGGPLLSTTGAVAGIVFARNAKDAELGYAMTNAELQPVAEAAPRLTAAVSSGACTRG